MSTEPLSSSSSRIPLEKKPLKPDSPEQKAQQATRRSWGFMDATFASRRRSPFQPASSQRTFGKASSDRNLSRPKEKPKQKKSSASDSPPLRQESPERIQKQEPPPSEEEQKLFEYDPEESRKENARLRALAARAKQPSVKVKDHTLLESLDGLPQRVEEARRIAAEKSAKLFAQFERGKKEIAEKYPKRPPALPPAPLPAPPPVSRERLLNIFTPPKKSSHAKFAEEMKKAGERLFAMLEKMPEKVGSPEAAIFLPPQGQEEKNLPLCLNVQTLMQLLRKGYTVEEVLIQGKLVRIAKIEATEEQLRNLPPLECISWIGLELCAIEDLQFHILCEKLSRSLERASLLICPKLSDLGLSALSQFSELKFLELDASGSITSKGISQLLEKCTHLEEVALFGITTDDAILKSFAEIKTLNLSRSNVTMKHLHEICKHSNLEKLIIEQCLIKGRQMTGRQMTATEIQELQQSYPKVIILCDVTTLLDPEEMEVGPPLTIESLKEMLGEKRNKVVVYNPHTEMSTYVEALSASPEVIAALRFPYKITKLHFVDAAITVKQLQALPLSDLEVALIYDCPKITEKGIASFTGLKRLGTDIPISNLGAVLEQSPQLQRLAVPAASLTAGAAEILAESSIKILEISSSETLHPETLVAATPLGLEKVHFLGPCPLTSAQVQHFKERYDTEITCSTEQRKIDDVLAESAEEAFPDQPSPEPLLSLHSGSEPDLDQLSQSLSYNSAKSIKEALSGKNPSSSSTEQEEEEEIPVMEEDSREYFTGVLSDAQFSQEALAFVSQTARSDIAYEETLPASVFPSSRATISHRATASNLSPVDKANSVELNHHIMLSNMRKDAERNQKLTFFPFFHEFARQHISNAPKDVLQMTDFQPFLPNCDWNSLLFFYKEKLLSYGISFEEIQIEHPSEEEIKELSKIKNLKREKTRLERLLEQENSSPNPDSDIINEGIATIANASCKIFEETIKMTWKDVIPNLVKLEKTKEKLQNARSDITFYIEKLQSLEIPSEAINWSSKGTMEEEAQLNNLMKQREDLKTFLKEERLNPNADTSKTEERIVLLDYEIRKEEFKNAIKATWEVIALDLEKIEMSSKEVVRRRQILNINLCIVKIGLGIDALNNQIKKDLIKKLECMTQAVSNLDRVFNDRLHTKIDPETGEEGLAKLSIDQFNEEGARIRNFKKLHFAGLKLTWLPYCLLSATWSQLEEVDVRKNWLVSLPQKCFYLAFLMKKFDASNNFISGFGEDLGMFWKNFDVIDLRFNRISVISPTFQLLHLGLPKEPLEPHKIHFLYLEGNPLSELKGFPKDSDVQVFLAPPEELP